jgi:hypothetical protein
MLSRRKSNKDSPTKAIPPGLVDQSYLQQDWNEREQVEVRSLSMHNQNQLLTDLMIYSRSRSKCSKF